MGARNSRPSLVTALDLQELGAELKIYGEIDDATMRYFNPSLAWHEEQLYISIRSCNFAVERHGKWYLRDNSAYSKTDVLLGKLNKDTLKVHGLTKLELSDNSPTRIKVAGLEDVRLFSRKDGLHAIGFESDRLTKSLHNASATLAEYLIDGSELKYIRTLQKPDKNVVEKNWQPVDNETAHFEFTYSPTQVWQGNQVLGEKYAGEIHGGTQLLEQADGTYLSLVHEKMIELGYSYGRNTYDKYTYITYLARHNKNGFIIQLSKPFRFGTHENIEFASGMVEHQGDLLISFGIRDCKYAIARISKEKLTNLLEEWNSNEPQA